MVVEEKIWTEEAEHKQEVEKGKRMKGERERESNMHESQLNARGSSINFTFYILRIIVSSTGYSLAIWQVRLRFYQIFPAKLELGSAAPRMSEFLHAQSVWIQSASLIKYLDGRHTSKMLHAYGERW